ncbi:MAG: phospho-sugar mutase, partial [Chlamydiia bacterium]|nr:phospho-sugar mutase [Chlamydiia bacterium]
MNNVQEWLQGAYDEKTKEEIKRLQDENPEALTDAFYTSLKFGTAGMRGLMGVGTNRMNTYTVRAASQGLANYLKKQPFSKAQISILIGYDSRHHSKEFALEAARIFAYNGIKAYLMKNLRPVPMVSFGTRFKHCQAGVMITASHNPAAYNGYKVYWSDGGQVLPPHDVGIVAEVNKISHFDALKTAPADDPLIIPIEEELDEAYL